MRVVIFKEADTKKLEHRINEWIENIEKKYLNFEIFEMLHPSDTCVSIWYKVMKG